MDKTIWVALIALIGIIFSALVSGIISYLVSKRTLNMEMRKLHFQIKNTYSNELLKKKIEVYPKIYYCLSSFAKKIERNSLTVDEIQKINEDFGQLDSEYALFFSPNTIDRCLKFRDELRNLIELHNDDLRRLLTSPEKTNALTNCIGMFELALQTELGVHGFESIASNGDLRLKYVNYYYETEQNNNLENKTTR